MKILFDLFPVLLFFTAYHLSGNIFIATSATMAASLAQIVFSWLRHRKIDPLLCISSALVIVLGSATLIFRDQLFIYWKPTALYWITAAGLLLAKFSKGINPIKKLMSAQLSLPEPIWERLNFAWAGFFTGMGGLNLFVAFTCSESFWVSFKLFGTLGLTVLFFIIQAALLSKYLQQDSPEAK